MRTPIIIGIAFALAVSVAPGTRAETTSVSVTEKSQGQPSAPGQQKRYRATRPIMPDARTGLWRLPTEQEVVDAVANLATLTDRSSEGLQQTQLASNAVVVELGNGFAGVLLARPNEDGTIETRCVFTFEEGAEFLGLIEAVQ